MQSISAARGPRKVVDPPGSRVSAPPAVITARRESSSKDPVGARSAGGAATTRPPTDAGTWTHRCPPTLSLLTSAAHVCRPPRATHLERPGALAASRPFSSRGSDIPTSAARLRASLPPSGARRSASMGSSVSWLSRSNSAGLTVARPPSRYAGHARRSSAARPREPRPGVVWAPETSNTGALARCLRRAMRGAGY